MKDDHRLFFRVWTGKRYLSPDEMEKMELSLSSTGSLVVGDAGKFSDILNEDFSLKDFITKRTVEMSTGLYDAKGAKVFVGDILEFGGLYLLVVPDSDTGGYGFLCPRFYNNGKDALVFNRSLIACMFKKGNIHDSADLLAKIKGDEECK